MMLKRILLSIICLLFLLFTLGDASPGWEIAWQPNLTGEMVDIGERNYRNTCPANESAHSGSKIRITVTAAAGGALVIDGTSIGVMTNVDDMDDAADGTFKRVTWTTAGGGNGITVGAGLSKVSDEITFNFDKTKRHGIHFYLASRQYSKYNNTTGDGFYYDIAGADDTLTQTVNYTPGADLTYVITKLEVFVEDEDEYIPKVIIIREGK